MSSSAQSLDLDLDVCAAQGCKHGSELFAYSIPICDWHWHLACMKMKDKRMPDILRDMIPQRDRHHVNETKR